MILMPIKIQEPLTQTNLASGLKPTSLETCNHDKGRHITKSGFFYKEERTDARIEVEQRLLKQSTLHAIITKSNFFPFLTGKEAFLCYTLLLHMPGNHFTIVQRCFGTILRKGLTLFLYDIQQKQQPFSNTVFKTITHKRVSYYPQDNFIKQKEQLLFLFSFYRWEN